MAREPTTHHSAADFDAGYTKRLEMEWGQGQQPPGVFFYAEHTRRRLMVVVRSLLEGAPVYDIQSWIKINLST